MTILISRRALVLADIIRGIDDDIKALREQGGDTSALEAERKQRAVECKFYLDQAVTVKRGQSDNEPTRESASGTT